MRPHLRSILAGTFFVVAGAAVVAVPRPADAFCGFYVSGADAKLFNNATQVVMMREGTRTVLSMANNYEGPPSNFAMVVPVPVILQKENVKTLPRELFVKIDQLDAPRLVEYWEQDPCAPDHSYAFAPGAKGGGVPTPRPAARGAKEDLGITVEAQFTVGEYDIVILSAKDASGLDTWLKQEHYKIPDGSEPYFRPYVQQGSKFFVARVDITKIKQGDVPPHEGGQSQLSPLRFHYDTESFNLPVRLGLVNSKGTQDLIVHILAKGQRYEVANYPNATIPTNLDVAESARDQFGSFYASLFDRTLEKNAKAVVTEYAWDASTCDPCPVPALDGHDLATLGADVLPNGDQPGGGGGAAPKPGRRLGFMPSGFTITRLHARYTKESLGEDLVFRAAPAIVGGREIRKDYKADGDLEHGATPTGGSNNFQGRYAIRHPWGGPVECKEPKRGRWGGPPGTFAMPGSGGSGAPKPARDLAFVPRDQPLAKFVRSEISELGIKPEGAPVSPVTPGSAAPASAPPTASVKATPATAPDAGKTADVPKSGCAGCAATGAGTTAGTTPALAALAALLCLLKSRRWTHRGRLSCRKCRE